MLALGLQPANGLHALQRVGLVVSHGDEQGTVRGNQPLRQRKAFAVQIAVFSRRGSFQHGLGLLGRALVALLLLDALGLALGPPGVLLGLCPRLGAGVVEPLHLGLV